MQDVQTTGNSGLGPGEWTDAIATLRTKNLVHLENLVNRVKLTSRAKARYIVFTGFTRFSR